VIDGTRRPSARVTSTSFGQTGCGDGPIGQGETDRAHRPVLSVVQDIRAGRPDEGRAGDHPSFPRAPVRFA
jgi:hypothetical protein